MNGFAGGGSPAGHLYVRALYDYEADDRTSLSFRQGDVIQVITQLESGWWDGVLDGVRGWFPSNYCAMFNASFDDGRHRTPGDSEAEESEEEYGEHELDGAGRDNVASGDASGISSQEQAAFWIPQATPDGRLFYFNTLTGVSTMELPLEAPTSADETGPRDRTNVPIPETTRPPAELMAAGYERDEDADYTSASETEDLTMSRRPRTAAQFRNGSHRVNGVSPTASEDSLDLHSSIDRSRAGVAQSGDISFSALHQGIPPIGTTMNSFANASGAVLNSTLMHNRLFDDTVTAPLTWNAMVEDMRRAVQRYRDAVRDGDRAEFVRRAEDISDHLRLLLAAGSGTTDNHSGNPSIISTNKALYPHFREMMSRFSKLVLSSHIAATDWSVSDSHSKCLQEAEGVLHGVYGFVEVARQQRGEEIPRLFPGFVTGTSTAASWQDNGLHAKDPLADVSFVDDELYAQSAPNVPISQFLIDRMEDLKHRLISAIHRVDEHLALREKMVTSHRQARVVDVAIQAGGSVLEAFRPFAAAVESINLASVGTTLTSVQLNDFLEHKQKLYDALSDFVVACHTVATPMADEWATVRGSLLEDRINRCRVAGRDLENGATQAVFCLQLLLELMPQHELVEKDPHRLTDGGAPYHRHLRQSSKDGRPLMLEEIGQSKSFSEGVDGNLEAPRSGDNSKVKRFFGEIPPLTIPSRDSEEVPTFLRLDHEAEMSYDTKHDPPQLRGGTLVGLVEQLTRHDKLDSGFNNTFLLTYQSFTTAPELFELLVKRWMIQPPPGISGADLQLWIDKKQKPIRFRVVNILKSWFDSYWMEPNDEASRQIIQQVHNFAKDTVASTSTPGAAPLLSAVDQRLRGQDSSNKKMVLTMSSQAPTPIVPKNMKKLKFLDIDPLEFARQLTIVESKLYVKIKPTECLNKTWQKKLGPGDPEPAENVKALILHSNQLTNWVAQMILTQSDVRRRVVVIKHFITIADKSRSLNNFSCLTSIISALSSAPIHRLNRTWSQVNTRTMATLESMRTLMGSTKNFLEYRDALHKANPPCIPFFGIYLTDLTFIDEGIPSIIKKTQLINFLKRAKTAEVIRDIQQFQNVPYGLQSVPELQEYILRNMQTAKDVHEMYERSLAVEPREREDERVARLLSESGFL